MKVILFDIDTLRADHMGCYGYGRDTTPVMDGIAKEGVCFDRYYCPNAPCLPSRASMVTGLYGIHNGIVGHGGTAADLRIWCRRMGFSCSLRGPDFTQSHFPALRSATRPGGFSPAWMSIIIRDSGAGSRLTWSHRQSLIG